MDKFSGRVAVVTGGANGIGLGLAKRFLEEGMKVVIADIDQDALDRATAELAPLGEIIGHRTDVADAASVQALADRAVEAFGAVHILCNNAGVGGFQRFGNTSLDTWRWIVGVDLWGVIHGCSIFMPILEKQEEAHIVNTASMSGFTYAPYHHPYNVSKAGVVALTESMHREFSLEKPHIGMSVLCPAFTATAIGNDERNAPAGHALRSETDPDLEEMRQHTNKMLDEGKTPAAVAEMVIDGIKTGKTHIFTHPEWLEVISNRSELILSGKPVLTTFSGPVPVNDMAR